MPTNVNTVERNVPLSKKKTCSHCKKSLPATSEYFYKRGDRPPGHFISACKACRAVIRKRSKAGLSEPEPYTSMEMREADGYKCLAVDALVIAVNDYKKGECEPEFFDSDMFKLLCELADCLPEYIRRGIMSEVK